MQFTKLRLVGFKSFVDPTELLIEPGITGIVGPNGCGKSNLVEAMKWVMGETSARQMRGGGMDDVIFSGTSGRPARNVAEVALELDNTDGTAPSQFNEFPELEIVRKIEREKGSTFKINSREVRARDVHLLFADQASGARSTALVGQGHIGEIISAKPTDRRKLLEEAAGITGLHSRRHEAELRLNGAETNLTRLDDILETLEEQMRGLRKQARQATRYSNLNDHIRKAQATYFLIKWNDAQIDLKQISSWLSDSSKLVEEATKEATMAATSQAEASSGIPNLRQKDAHAVGNLQRLTIELENIEKEEERISTSRKELKDRLIETNHDMERETNLLTDSKVAIESLESEMSLLKTANEAEIKTLSDTQKTLELAEANLEQMEDTARKHMSELASAEATAFQSEQRKHFLTDRIRQQSSDLEQAQEKIKVLENSPNKAILSSEVEQELEQLLKNLDKHRDKLSLILKQLNDALNHLTVSKREAQTAFENSTKLKAEEEALTRLLGSNDPELWPPLIDSLTVDVGYEAALGVALGEDLAASTNSSAPIHWSGNTNNSSNLTPLPPGTKPLSDYVTGPSALAKRLEQLAVAKDSKVGAVVAKELKQGQRLVALDGGFWRWDGFTASSDAPVPATIRLEHRNQLKHVRRELLEAQRITEEKSDFSIQAETNFEQLKLQESEAQTLVRNTEEIFLKRQKELNKQQTDISENALALSAQREAYKQLKKEHEESKSELEEIQKVVAESKTIERFRDTLEEKNIEVEKAREEYISVKSYFDSLENKAKDRNTRLTQISSDLEAWNTRNHSAREQISGLEKRKLTLSSELTKLDSAPEQITEKRQSLLSQLEEAKRDRSKTSDALLRAEKLLSEADENVKKSESKLAQLREDKVRRQAELEHAQQTNYALEERIQEQVKCSVNQLHELANVKEELDLPDLVSAENKMERLIRERENMGPVNLLAEKESRDLIEQIDTLTSERSDLIKAIDKLRNGISELNKEGRRRLLSSFNEVNKHFQELFIRLFAGGKAHLTLVDSDDPLDAGIEIMARPPGKRLQTLSLLSGGEQALTAIALLFAVFLTNPAPICILDEVDAPLDDHNVDRFCLLVEELTKSLSTRFVIITHHRMTMARVDRLFGVTMGERGVSQLVSVDLGKAIELKDIA